MIRVISSLHVWCRLWQMEEARGILMKWKRKRPVPSLQGTLDLSILSFTPGSSQAGSRCSFAFAAMISNSSSHKRVVSCLLSSSALLPHTDFLGKNWFWCPCPPKQYSCFPIRLGIFIAIGPNYHTCMPTVNSTCWLNTGAKYPLALRLQKYAITKQEPFFFLTL